jgi:hypothetical protein
LIIPRHNVSYSLWIDWTPWLQKFSLSRFFSLLFFSTSYSATSITTLIICNCYTLIFVWRSYSPVFWNVHLPISTRILSGVGLIHQELVLCLRLHDYISRCSNAYLTKQDTQQL